MYGSCWTSISMSPTYRERARGRVQRTNYHCRVLSTPQYTCVVLYESSTNWPLHRCHGYATVTTRLWQDHIKVIACVLLNQSNSWLPILNITVSLCLLPHIKIYIRRLIHVYILLASWIDWCRITSCSVQCLSWPEGVLASPKPAT